MYERKSWTLAAKLFAAAAVVFMVSIGLCGGGIVFSKGSSKVMELSFAAGLVALALSIVLGVVALISYFIWLSNRPKY